MQSKLGRKIGHRKQVIANLATSLILHEKITTTVIKAKTVAPFVERIFTNVRKDDLASRRQVTAALSDKKAVSKLFTQALPNVTNIKSGFSSIYKIQPRKGDGAPMAIIQLNESIFKSDKTEKTAEKVITSGIKEEKKPKKVTK